MYYILCSALKHPTDATPTGRRADADRTPRQRRGDAAPTPKGRRADADGTPRAAPTPTGRRADADGTPRRRRHHPPTLTSRRERPELRNYPTTRWIEMKVL